MQSNSRARAGRCSAETDVASGRTSPLPGLHAAIIMDGNGRWASRRGVPRSVGHRAGAKVVERIVPEARELGIGTLTLYAFSCDNWSRPPAEVRALFELLEGYLAGEISRLRDNGVALNIVGRRDRFSKRLLSAIERAEDETAAGDRLDLRIAVDYSGRDSILRAMSLSQTSATAPLAGADFEELLSRAIHARVVAPPVDVVVRTSGERRLSDFLLWETAYAELVFVDKLWPDFEPADLAAALAEFQCRERRFGRATALAAAS